ncbi:hypothetical protein PoB_003437700 [Plakobranchus ocellatus]|uniref:Uncharacterized protein n=1 Tax=Plakobranchus ocellatus TaxID=259542 RepID=A0AAV4ALR7_9GAST|nr:hypothetical protein PoB_003437700 [Plakobranchus ocellatus]
MARHDWFHPGIYLFLVLAFSLSMVSNSDGQVNPVFKFSPFTIEFTQERLERFLRCMCTARTSTCQQDYKLTSAFNYAAQGNVRSENISATREVEIRNVAGHPAFVKGSCETPGGSPRSGYNDDNNDVGNNDGNNDAGNNDNNKDAGNNNGNNDSNNDEDTTGLMVAAAVGWLLFGLLAGTNFALLYCWRCRKTLVINRRNQSEQKNTKFVASQNRSLPSGYGDHLPTSQQGRGNVNKNNGHSNGYTDYIEVNDEYTVIDDEKMPNVKKEITKTNGVEPTYKNVLPHSPPQMSEDGSLKTINGYTTMTITSGDVSQRNKQSIEETEACARLQTGRLAADLQMSKGAMLTYDIPSGTLANNGKAMIDSERPGRAEDAVNESVHPSNIAPAVYDEQDESASHHYKSPPIRNTEALEG